MKTTIIPVCDVYGPFEIEVENFRGRPRVKLRSAVLNQSGRRSIWISDRGANDGEPARELYEALKAFYEPPTVTINQTFNAPPADPAVADAALSLSGLLAHLFADVQE